MLDVTTRARDSLRELLTTALAERNGPNGHSLGFRLVTSGDGPGDEQLGLVLDAPRPGDMVVDHDGLAVLILDALVSELLDDLTLDVFETSEGEVLQLRELPASA